jgi:ATP-dependent DNA ligase
VIAAISEVLTAVFSDFSAPVNSTWNGIVAKRKDGPYVADRKRSSWFEIKNPKYSQLEGREDVFDRS